MRYAIAVAAAWAVVSAASADIAALQHPLDHAAPALPCLADGIPVPTALAPQTRVEPLPQAGIGVALFNGAPGDESQVRALPALPSSLSLVFSGFGALGAWHLGRASRKIHLSHVPEWFHSGGPDQIGYASVMDLESAGAAPAAILAPPLGAPPDCIRTVAVQAFPRRFHQFFLSVLAPRAPPRMS